MKRKGIDTAALAKAFRLRSSAADLEKAMLAFSKFNQNKQRLEEMSESLKNDYLVRFYDNDNGPVPVKEDIYRGRSATEVINSIENSQMYENSRFSSFAVRKVDDIVRIRNRTLRKRVLIRRVANGVPFQIIEENGGLGSMAMKVKSSNTTKDAKNILVNLNTNTSFRIRGDDRECYLINWTSHFTGYVLEGDE
jgi:uncharacterized UPF0160 family protein